MARTAHLNMVIAGVEQSKSQAKDGAHAIPLSMSVAHAETPAPRAISRGRCENFPPVDEDSLL
jgi:hypothetical protein